MAEDKHEQPHTPAPAKGARIPATAVAAAYAPHAAGEDDASAEANSRIATEIADRVSPPIPAERLVTAPTSDPLVSGRAMYVLVGPYRGNLLTMPDGEAESAKDNHWAIDLADMNKPFDADNPYDHDHELTDEDRAYAVKEANEWAEAQWNPPEEEEGAPEGETEDAKREREMRNERRRAQAKRRNEQKEQKPKPRQQPAQQPGHQPAHQPGQQANHKARAVEADKPAGTYETR